MGDSKFFLCTKHPAPAHLLLLLRLVVGVKALRVQGHITPVTPELGALLTLLADPSQVGHLDEMAARVQPDLLPGRLAHRGDHLSLVNRGAEGV